MLTKDNDLAYNRRLIAANKKESSFTALCGSAECAVNIWICQSAWLKAYFFLSPDPGCYVAMSLQAVSVSDPIRRCLFIISSSLSCFLIKSAEQQKMCYFSIVEDFRRASKAKCELASNLPSTCQVLAWHLPDRRTGGLPVGLTLIYCQWISQ